MADSSPHRESELLSEQARAAGRRLVKKLGRHGLSGLVGALLATILGVIHLDPGLFFLPNSFGLATVRESYDLLFPMRGTIPLSQEEVVVVYLDDTSFESLKQPYLEPWKREFFTQLMKRLMEERAAGVVFDIVFSDSSRDASIDEDFARGLKGFTNYVIAADWTTPEPGKKLRTVKPPNDGFFDQIEQLGLSEMQPDDDLFVRELFPGADTEGVYSLSWAMAKVMRISSVRGATAAQERRYINFYGFPGHVPFVSFYKVIQDVPDQVPPGFFTGKVVFVGERIVTFRPGQRKDEYISPFSYWSPISKFMPGVEIHATQYLNLLRGDWISRMPKIYEGALIVLMGMALGIFLAGMRPLAATFVALVAAVGVAALAYLTFTRIQMWFPWMVIVKIQIPAALFWSLVYNSVTLYVQKRLMEQSVAMYVSPKRAAQIAKSGERSMLKPGAHKQEVSVLFSDIANFTTFSEGMPSNELADLMNSYFDKALENCLDPTDGTVVKFIGDAIFAVWNAPEAQANHHELACRGALKLRNERSALEAVKSRFPGLDVRTRIGLHSGLADVGNFGGRRRVDYTMFGENINLASRMEGLNKFLGTDVLLTGDIESKVRGKFVTRYAGRFRLKGFEKRAVDVYELIDEAGKEKDTELWRLLYEQARVAFTERRFAEARDSLLKLLEARPEDGPAKFLMKYVEDYLEEPPSEAWKGEIELKEK
ncbi:MAG: adenylate/guanylate cyclase domain-containing protein [Verrucomicrobia bacterium]|nr:adenylate/guanylate cyclase domain-containing protein [Verrucomicrobiota bacterium]